MNICVFAGSRVGADPEYSRAARSLGLELAGRGLGLVYGAGQRGLMGVLADATLAAGGEVIGIIPEFLARPEREIPHPRLTRLHVVSSMHERKALMAELSSGFIALPGGYGTFEELLESLTWNQLGLHSKPCAVLNINGYFEPLVALLEQAVTQQFLLAAQRELLIVEDTPASLIDAIRNRITA